MAPTGQPVKPAQTVSPAFPKANEVSAPQTKGELKDKSQPEIKRQPDEGRIQQSKEKDHESEDKEDADNDIFKFESEAADMPLIDPNVISQFDWSEPIE